jgi:AcrR family transcriptional regulator
VAVGLRERKKQQTRQLILDTARRLFEHRGFEAVTVAEIARAADVSEVTVFNYFPTKENLFFDGMESFETKLLDAVRDRPAGQSALAAFRRVVVEGCERLTAVETSRVIAKAAGMIDSSPALQARERMITAQYTELLARILADDVGSGIDAVEPMAVAGALMAVQRALVHYVRRGVVAGKRGATLSSDARLQARRGFARLERGIGEYARRR